MVCRSCGTPCPPGARHCPDCGMRLYGAGPGIAAAHSAPDATLDAAARATTPLPPGTLLNGRYRVESVLGAGAFGRVYLTADAQDPLGAPIAVKELLDTQFTSAEDKHDAITWFKREVSTLLSLEHPRIPQIYSYWTTTTTSGPFYLAMEYVQGSTLEQVLDQHGQITWQDALRWGIELCDVLAYLHSRTPPFIFRDMKLPNVMLSQRTGHTVLIDFGITRQLATSGGTAIGTWGYVPYEQVLGKAEPRSDLYALGALLHCLLSGRRPDSEYTRLMRGGLDVEAAMKALFPPLSACRPELPAGVGDCIARATAFAADDRYPDAASMASALAHVLGALPPGSTPFLGTVLPAPRAPGAAPRSSTPATVAATLSRTIVVCKAGTGHFTTIEQALRIAQPGALIEVRAGVYRESLVLETPVEIVGSPRAEDVVLEGVVGPALTLCRSEITVRDMTLLAHPSAQGDDHFAVLVTEGSPTLEDCYISSSSLAGLAIIGPSANPQIRRCKILNGQHAGIIVSEGALATIEHCDIYGNMSAGVEIQRQANPILRRCTIRDGRDVGIFVLDHGQGVIEDCEITRNALMGVAIKEGSTPTLRRCRIVEGYHAGILAYAGGRGTIQNCDIGGNTNAGIGITQDADPVVWHCRIYGGRGDGVMVEDTGRGTIDGCEIVHNAGAGVVIAGSAAPVIRQSRITHNGTVGVHVLEKGAGAVEGCDLVQNAHGAWDRPLLCRVRRSNNRE
jgi:F-box protein 11